MRLSLVGHASVIIEASDVRLLTDPWLTGLAFNDSWALHPEPRLRQEDLDSLTHLWISHEHPDHFSPASLHSIPSEVRARVILLFQRRYSSEVVDFFATLGFRDVIELPMPDSSRSRRGSRFTAARSAMRTPASRCGARARRF